MNDETGNLVRIGLVGCGAQAKEHMMALRRLRNYRVVALCDADQARAAQMAREWRIDRHYTKFSEMLDSEELSIATIITPPQSHAPLIIQSIDHGVNLLVEKPLTMTAKDAKSVLDALTNSQLKLTVNYNALFSRTMLRALALLKKGDVGQVLGVEVKMLDAADDPMAADPTHWAHKLPGGRFGEMLSHPVYLVQSLLGNDVKVEQVFADKKGNIPWMKYDELHIMLKNPDAIAHVYCSFNAPRQEMQIEVFGSRKILKIDLENQTLVALGHRTLSKVGSGRDASKVIGDLAFQTARNAVNYLRTRRGQTAIRTAYVNLAKSIYTNAELIVRPEMTYNTVRISEEICNRL